MLRKLWAVLLLTGMSFLSFGYDYSYIYIQGDLETPFYVKLEGQMLPRLGKNYCIIPNLDTGIIHVQILFQQNAYPEQEFAIRVPEAGARGFALQKINDRQFALHDLQSGNYLIAGNEDDNESMLPRVLREMHWRAMLWISRLSVNLLRGVPKIIPDKTSSRIVLLMM